MSDQTLGRSRGGADKHCVTDPESETAVASRCEYRWEHQIYCNICMRFVVSEEASPNAEKNEVLRCASVAKRGDDGDHGVIDVVF